MVYRYLQIWSTCQQRRTGLEYPGITPEARLISSPGRSTKKGRGPSYEPDPADILVENAVREIGGLYECLLRLRYIDGITYPCMAASMNKPVGHVRWIIEKATRELAKTLNIQMYS